MRVLTLIDKRKHKTGKYFQVEQSKSRRPFSPKELFWPLSVP